MILSDLINNSMIVSWNEIVTIHRKDSVSLYDTLSSPSAGHFFVLVRSRDSKRPLSVRMTEVFFGATMLLTPASAKHFFGLDMCTHYDPFRPLESPPVKTIAIMKHWPAP